jgi:hypothetical protein
MLNKSDSNRISITHWVMAIVILNLFQDLNKPIGYINLIKKDRHLPIFLYMFESNSYPK